jgi:hypothetical protein
VYDLTPQLPETAVNASLWGVLANDWLPLEQAAALRHWLTETLPVAALSRPEELRLAVFARVLADLAGQGWHFHSSKPGRLKAYAPDSTPRTAQPGYVAPAPLEIKQHLRQGLVAHRDEQLADPLNQRFIQRMERVRYHEGRRVSVRHLLADPQVLANDIEAALRTAEPKRTTRLMEVVKPYLQLVTEDLDEHTGLRLLDIWRYCRYTWSLPFNTQPGRRMFYLVRDAARVNHPVMGIAALGSAVVQISCRDEFVGWTLSALRLAPDPIARLQALRAELRRAIDEVYCDDFLAEQLITPTDLAAPTLEVGLRLRAAAALLPVANRGQHKLSSSLEWDARTDLFRRKRAVTLAELFNALCEFDKAALLEENVRLESLLSYKDGKKALSIALRSIKKRHVAASMMEITTCGAIPPYGDLLGGKLVAMLMASPQVTTEYRQRYRTMSSVIASRMSGKEFVRQPELVLLGTTSLYHVGSSQYNRIKIPTAKGALKYIGVGRTEGFGHVHLSQHAYNLIQEMLRDDQSEQSYTFAAGVNYKMRSIASALAMLGLQRLQNHASPRLVYALPIATNWQQFLLGMDSEPNWHFAQNNPKEGTQQIIDFWKTRWFTNRAQRPETLAKLNYSSVLPSLANSGDSTPQSRDPKQIAIFFSADHVCPE